VTYWEKETFRIRGKLRSPFWMAVTTQDHVVESLHNHDSILHTKAFLDEILRSEPISWASILKIKQLTRHNLS
jgi:hypothetical protein